MFVGQLFAPLSIVANGVASVVESVGARRATARSTSILRQPVYLVGLTADLIGFVATLVAMQHLPLFVVQSAVASSVGVTALIAARMSSRLGRGAVIALAAMVIGLVLLGVSGAPERPMSLPLVWQWILLLLAAPLLMTTRTVKSRRRSTGAAVLLALLAGVGRRRRNARPDRDRRPAARRRTTTCALTMSEAVVLFSSTTVPGVAT